LLQRAFNCYGPLEYGRNRPYFFFAILLSVNALLLFSHGSVLCGSQRTLENLAERLRAQNAAPIIEIGFLNYSPPLFPEAFARCVEQGATQITIVPYFLVAGKFVRVDLPRAIEAQQARFPNVKVKIAEAMRFHESLADAVIACANRAQPPAAWRDLLQIAPEWCRADAACPLYGTEKCPATQTL
jgi:sirohydrochlorin ferrochelatase